MTSGDTDIQVYRDEQGNLYLRVPAEQQAAIEQALAGQDTAGYAWGSQSSTLGSLTLAGILSQVQNPGQSQGIIIIGGRVG